MNNIRVGNVTDHDIRLLRSRHISKYPSISKNAVYIFAENSLKDAHNSLKLSELDGHEIIIHAIDRNPAGISLKRIESVANRGASQCGGLSKILMLKHGARVMLTSNMH